MVLGLMIAFSGGGSAEAARNGGPRMEDHDVTFAIVRDGKTYTLQADFLLLNDGSGHADADLRAAKAELLANLNQAAGQTAGFSSSGYVLAGYSWASHTASYGYNAAGKPSSLGGDLAAVQASANTWSSAGANFSFTGGGATTIGAGACNGTHDGVNTVGWKQQSGSILAVTCTLYGGANEAEFDMQISPGWNWTTGSTPNVDLQSVVTHEFGHALGLNHSTNSGAVMYASYTAGTLKRSLTADDIAGLTAIYGAGSGGGSTTTTTATATPTKTSTPAPTATTAPAVKAALASPAPGTTLTTSTANFAWSAGSQALEYFLYVGTTAGSNSIYGRSQALATSVSVSGIPINGSPVYVRLWTRFATGWQYSDYTYATKAATTTTPATPAKAALSSPANGSNLSGGAATFSWSSGTSASQYFLYIGTSAGSNNLYGQSQGLNRSVSLGGLPRNGTRLYVRLWTLLPTGWQYADYQFTSY